MLVHDVLVIGAGPVGLACAIEARRHGLTAINIDKGALVNSIVGYPANMEFFSTPELIEIGGYPFPVQNYKPTREEAIEYYRGVTTREALDVRLYERVLEVRHWTDHYFSLRTTRDPGFRFENGHVSFRSRYVQTERLKREREARRAHLKFFEDYGMLLIPAYVALMEADAKVALDDHGDEGLAQQFRRQGEKAEEILAALEGMDGDLG